MIAGPTVDAMRYAGNEPGLRNLFANLLANAMDFATSTKAHPAYVEVIKQLSPAEAKILTMFASRPLLDGAVLPIADLGARVPGQTASRLILDHFTMIARNAGCQEHVSLESFQRTASYVDNLCRLELLRIPFGKYASGDEFYKHLEQHPFVKGIRESLEAQGEELHLHRAVIRVTGFGRDFIRSCVIDKDQQE